VPQDGGGRDCALSNRLSAGSSDRTGRGRGVEEYAGSHCEAVVGVRGV